MYQHKVVSKAEVVLLHLQIRHILKVDFWIVHDRGIHCKLNISLFMFLADGEHDEHYTVLTLAFSSKDLFVLNELNSAASFIIVKRVNYANKIQTTTTTLQAAQQEGD